MVNSFINTTNAMGDIHSPSSRSQRVTDACEMMRRINGINSGTSSSVGSPELSTVRTKR